MNIQISTVIWTVICFVLFFLVLTNLLFKPVLKVIDERNEKIGNAKRKKADALLEAEKQAEAEKERLILEAQQAELDKKAQAEKVRLEGKMSLEEARKERITAVENFSKKTDAEFTADMQKAKENMDNLSASFLDKLFAN